MPTIETDPRSLNTLPDIFRTINGINLDLGLFDRLRESDTPDDAVPLGRGDKGTKGNFPRIILRDALGRELDTFTTLQEAIYRAKWNVKQSGQAKEPLEWRLPKAPPPARPDLTRTFPPLKHPPAHPPDARLKAKFDSSRVLEFDVEDVGFVRESLQYLPYAPSLSFLKQEILVGPKTYFQIVGTMLLHKKFLSQTEKRHAIYNFPGFCSGCIRMGLCYGCERSSEIHFHEDKPVKTGGGFTYFKKDRPENEIKSRNPINWKIQHPDKALKKLMEEYAGVQLEGAIPDEIKQHLDKHGGHRERIVSNIPDFAKEMQEFNDKGKLNRGDGFLPNIHVKYDPQDGSDGDLEGLGEGQGGRRDHDLDSPDIGHRGRRGNDLENEDDDYSGRRHDLDPKDVRVHIQGQGDSDDEDDYNSSQRQQKHRSGRGKEHVGGVHVPKSGSTGWSKTQSGILDDTLKSGYNTSDDEGRRAASYNRYDKHGHRLPKYRRVESGTDEENDEGEQTDTEDYSSRRGRRREKLYKDTDSLHAAPPAFKLKKSPKRSISSKSPFSTDRVYDLPKGKGLDIKKSDKAPTQFKEFRNVDVSWKEPKKFELKKNENKTTKFWSGPPPKKKEKKKGERSHGLRRVPSPRSVSPDSGLDSEFLTAGIRGKPSEQFKGKDRRLNSEPLLEEEDWDKAADHIRIPTDGGDIDSEQTAYQNLNKPKIRQAREKAKSKNKKIGSVNIPDHGSEYVQFFDGESELKFVADDELGVKRSVEENDNGMTSKSRVAEDSDVNFTSFNGKLKELKHDSHARKKRQVASLHKKKTRDSLTDGELSLDEGDKQSDDLAHKLANQNSGYTRLGKKKHEGSWTDEELFLDEDDNASDEVSHKLENQSSGRTRMGKKKTGGMLTSGEPSLDEGDNQSDEVSHKITNQSSRKSRIRKKKPGEKLTHGELSHDDYKNQLDEVSHKSANQSPRNTNRSKHGKSVGTSLISDESQSEDSIYYSTNQSSLDGFHDTATEYYKDFDLEAFRRKQNLRDQLRRRPNRLPSLGNRSEANFSVSILNTKKDMKIPTRKFNSQDGLTSRPSLKNILFSSPLPDSPKHRQESRLSNDSGSGAIPKLSSSLDEKQGQSRNSTKSGLKSSSDKQKYIMYQPRCSIISPILYEGENSETKIDVSDVDNSHGEATEEVKEIYNGQMTLSDLESETSAKTQQRHKGHGSRRNNADQRMARRGRIRHGDFLERTDEDPYESENDNIITAVAKGQNEEDHDKMSFKQQDSRDEQYPFEMEKSFNRNTSRSQGRSHGKGSFVGSKLTSSSSRAPPSKDQIWSQTGSPLSRSRSNSPWTFPDHRTDHKTSNFSPSKRNRSRSMVKEYQKVYQRQHCQKSGSLPVVSFQNKEGQRSSSLGHFTPYVGNADQYDKHARGSGTNTRTSFSRGSKTTGRMSRSESISEDNEGMWNKDEVNRRRRVSLKVPTGRRESFLSTVQSQLSGGNLDANFSADEPVDGTTTHYIRNHEKQKGKCERSMKLQRGFGQKGDTGQSEAYYATLSPPLIPSDVDMQKGSLTSEEPDLELAFDDVIDVENLEVDENEDNQIEDIEQQKKLERKRRHRHRKHRKRKKGELQKSENIDDMEETVDPKKMVDMDEAEEGKDNKYEERDKNNKDDTDGDANNHSADEGSEEELFNDALNAVAKENSEDRNMSKTGEKTSKRRRYRKKKGASSEINDDLGGREHSRENHKQSRSKDRKDRKSERKQQTDVTDDGHTDVDERDRSCDKHKQSRSKEKKGRKSERKQQTKVTDDGHTDVDERDHSSDKHKRSRSKERKGRKSERKQQTKVTDDGHTDVDERDLTCDKHKQSRSKERKDRKSEIKKQTYVLHGSNTEGETDIDTDNAETLGRKTEADSQSESESTFIAKSEQQNRSTKTIGRKKHGQNHKTEDPGHDGQVYGVAETEGRTKDGKKRMGDRSKRSREQKGQRKANIDNSGHDDAGHTVRRGRIKKKDGRRDSLSEEEIDFSKLPSIKSQLAKIFESQNNKNEVKNIDEDISEDRNIGDVADQGDSSENETEIEKNPWEQKRPQSAERRNILEVPGKQMKKYRSLSMPLLADIEELQQRFGKLSLEQLKAPFKVPIYLPSFKQGHVIIKKKFKLNPKRVKGREKRSMSISVLTLTPQLFDLEDTTNKSEPLEPVREETLTITPDMGLSETAGTPLQHRVQSPAPAAARTNHVTHHVTRHVIHRHKGDNRTSRKVKVKGNEIQNTELVNVDNEQSLTKLSADENDISGFSADEFYERKLSVEEIFRSHTFGSLEDGVIYNNYVADKPPRSVTPPKKREIVKKVKKLPVTPAQEPKPPTPVKEKTPSPVPVEEERPVSREISFDFVKEKSIPELPPIEIPELPEIQEKQSEYKGVKKERKLIEVAPEIPEPKKKLPPPPKLAPRIKTRTSRKSKVAEAPVTTQELQQLSDPLDFLAKYCIINPDRLPYYERVFNGAVNVQTPRYTRDHMAARGEIVHLPPAQLSEHELNMLKDLTVITHAQTPRRDGMSVPEQYLEKLNYSIEFIKAKQDGLQDHMHDLQVEKIHLMAQLAKELDRDIIRVDYKSKGKKKKKKKKKKKSEEPDYDKMGAMSVPKNFIPQRASDITDEVIVSRMDDKMMKKVKKDPTVKKLQMQISRDIEKLKHFDQRIAQVEDEKDLVGLYCMDYYFNEQDESMTPYEFRRQQSRLYQKLHPDPDIEMNTEEVETALQQINNKLLSEKEFQYIYFVLDLPKREKINFRLFSIIAALSEKVTQMDPVIRKLINKVDYNALDVKMEKSKELFELLQDESQMPVGNAPAETLAVELTAGGLTPEHTNYVLSKFNREGRGFVDFLDFVTYVPLFIEIHKRIIEDPFNDSLNV